MTHWHGLRPLASGNYWYLTLTGTPLGYLVNLHHRDPAALEMPSWPLCMLEKFLDRVDVGVGQLIALLLGLVCSWVGQFSNSSLSTRSSSSVLPRLVHPKGQQQAMVPCSPALTPLWQTHVHLYHQDQIYCTAQARCRACSSEYCTKWGTRRALMTSGPSLSPATGSKGQGREDIFHP